MQTKTKAIYSTLELRLLLAGIERLDTEAVAQYMFRKPRSEVTVADWLTFHEAPRWIAFKCASALRVLHRGWVLDPFEESPPRVVEILRRAKIEGFGQLWVSVLPKTETLLSCVLSVESYHRPESHFLAVWEKDRLLEFPPAR